MPNQPLKIPIIQKPTPVVLDQLLIESEDSNSAPFDRMLELGHYHADQIRFPGYRLLKSGANSFGVFQRTWGSDPVSQDSYNLTKEYELEANSSPTFIRSYRVLRSDYLVNGPATKGLPFTGVAAIAVTAGGTGYTKDFAMTGAGGLAGIAIVNRGAVIRIEITNVGTGYGSAPSVDLSGGDGSGATAAAVIQPAAAVLVSEKHSKLPEDDPYSNLYDRVVRVYQTLPGVVLTEYDQDEETLSLITTTYQVVANPVSAPTVVQGVVTAFKRIDSTKSLKIVRTIAKPSGYDEQRLMAYRFESLFDYTVYIFTDACGAFSNIRAGFSTLVQARVSISFDNTKQTISGLSLIPKTLQLGRGVQIHEAVLVDAGTYTYTGACTATVTWGASSPDYSTYVGTIQGTEQTISGESVLWKAGYYRTTTVKVTML